MRRWGPWDQVSYAYHEGWGQRGVGLGDDSSWSEKIGSWKVKRGGSGARQKSMELGSCVLLALIGSSRIDQTQSNPSTNFAFNYVGCSRSCLNRTDCGDSG